jgi:hypothetical protein
MDFQINAVSEIYTKICMEKSILSRVCPLQLFLSMRHKSKFINFLKNNTSNKRKMIQHNETIKTSKSSRKVSLIGKHNEKKGKIIMPLWSVISLLLISFVSSNMRDCVQCSISTFMLHKGLRTNKAKLETTCAGNRTMDICRSWFYISNYLRDMASN